MNTTNSPAPTLPSEPSAEALRAAELAAIGERLRTQDNRITENPMFCVQTKKRDILPDGFSCDTIWVLDGEEVDANTEGAEEYGYRDRWETVMVAFTEGGCKEYLRQNGHNLKEPRIYVESFNRCPEMIAIREDLMSSALLTRLSAMEEACEWLVKSLEEYREAALLEREITLGMSMRAGGGLDAARAALARKEGK